MKKLHLPFKDTTSKLLLSFCIVLIFVQNVWAQNNSCLNAINITPGLSCNFVSTHFEAGDSTLWYTIVPDSSVLKIAFQNSIMMPNAQITSVNFYDGTGGCSNLILIDTVVIDSLGYYITLVNPGQVYYFEIFRSQHIVQEYFDVCFQQDNIICGEGKCIGYGTPMSKLPFSQFYENCDIGLNYAVDYHTLATRSIFGLQANPQNFTISGIPPGAIIDGAYVWWTLGVVSENNLSSLVGSINFNGNVIPGTILPFVGGNMGTINPATGHLMSKGCWGNLGAVGLRADVSPFVFAGGNGTYSIRRLI